MLDTAWQDLRHGTRMLAKTPGFTLVAVFSIAIGVGANTAMFSVADGLIFRPLGVPEASALVTVNGRLLTGDVRNGGISYPDYADLRDQSRSFESLTAFRGVLASFARRRDEQAEGRYGLAVTGTFFAVLGVRPALGRVFVADEDRVPGRDAVVVLAHETWTEQFGADLAIVGRDIRLGGRDFTVVGVAPERFTGVDIYLPPAFYVPLAMLPAINAGETGLLQRRDVRRLDVLGRLRPGVSLAQASQEAGLIATALAQTHPATNRQYGMLVRTETEARFEEYAPMYALGHAARPRARGAAGRVHQRRGVVGEPRTRAGA